MRLKGNVRDEFPSLCTRVFVWFAALPAEQPRQRFLEQKSGGFGWRSFFSYYYYYYYYYYYCYCYYYYYYYYYYSYSNKENDIKMYA